MSILRMIVSALLIICLWMVHRIYRECPDEDYTLVGALLVLAVTSVALVHIFG